MRAVCFVLAVLAFAVSPLAVAAPCGGFTDVDDANPAHAPFCDSVEWVRNRAITLGCNDPPTLYCPDLFVTRLQMAGFLYRLGFQNAFLQGGNAFDATAVLGTTDAQPVEIHVNQSRVMRYESADVSPNVIGGHAFNRVVRGGPGAAVFGTVIAGGGTDGVPNRVNDNYGVVGGGWGNQAGNEGVNPYDAHVATVGGGMLNKALGQGSTVGGGAQNTASGLRSMVPGGTNNTASGDDSFAAGAANTAGGAHSFAVGRGAQAQADGAFVWSDDLPFFDPALVAGGWTDATNTFTARARGGVWFISGTEPDGTPTAGCKMEPGVGTWSCTSSRHAKTDFARADVSDVLDRVVALPIETWRFRGEDGGIRHLGPTAQDFRAAFGLGARDTEIATVDADGVALAAIQGLNAKLEAERATKDAEIAALRAELAAIRALLVGRPN